VFAGLDLIEERLDASFPAEDLYLGNQSTVDRVLTRLRLRRFRAQIYWDRVGVTVVDPDGFRVVLVSQIWQRSARS
jgi:hypothetical protein